VEEAAGRAITRSAFLKRAARDVRQVPIDVALYNHGGECTKCAAIVHQWTFGRMDVWTSRASPGRAYLLGPALPRRKVLSSR
jgi:hypothetical protein